MNSNTTSNTTGTQFEVYVSNDTFKFNAAHFVAYENYRERLHGHNYRVSVRLIGERQQRIQRQDVAILGPDGYLIDFTNVKKITKQVCQQLNEHFICPMYSNVLDISTIYLDSDRDNDSNDNCLNDNNTTTSTNDDNNTITPTPTQQQQQQQKEYIQIICHVDQTKFIFPKKDCILLPIVHATAEELAIYIYCQILNSLNANYLLQRNIYCMEITIAEAIGQEATFRHPIPITTTPQQQPSTTTTTTTTDHHLYNIDVREFIMSGNIVPMPCISSTSITTLSSSSSLSLQQQQTTTYNNNNNNNSDSNNIFGTSRTTTTCCQCCRNNNCNNQSMTESSSMFNKQQLQQIVDAINNGSLSLLQDEQQLNQK